MEAKTKTGLKAKIFFVCRSGNCPDCDTLMDVSGEEIRYCPKCKENKLGKIKSEGGN